MNPNARHRARECAVQALYSWQVSKNPINEVEVHFIAEQDTKGADLQYFRELLSGVSSNKNTLDQLMNPHLSRELGELGDIELTIIRIAIYELAYRQDVPPKVIVNEAIELAKSFGAEDSHKFVNGVLDKLIPQLRTKKII
ncbi:transcription antitermination factor NusB [Thorsellia anophelis]|uniref:Transcription antitermination protein NusB n=1 Tax=Thorsellia anophelis DSM 18579 TaxID=1123402 RepID=A0A1I0EHC0_9GAMM|nr:transcription antitermination factor NusB [Thorsellia anophelis]SET43852.1 NusB antitermination factor [Thorsellia anophelis DSM 18579]